VELLLNFGESCVAFPEFAEPHEIIEFLRHVVEMQRRHRTKWLHSRFPPTNHAVGRAVDSRLVSALVESEATHRAEALAIIPRPEPLARAAGSSLVCTVVLAVCLIVDSIAAGEVAL